MSTLAAVLHKVKPDFLSKLTIVILGAIPGILFAYLITTGSWQIVLGLFLALLILPAFILLLKYPFSALFIWLALAPFLMTTDTTPERVTFWVIHRALPPATLAIVVLAHVLKIKQRTLPRLGWAEFAMTGYVVTGLLSIITLNDDPLATSILFYDRVFSPMCLYLIVRLSAPDEKDLQRLMPIIFFVGASQSIIGLLAWAAPHVLPAAWLGQLDQRTIGSLINTGVYTTTLIFCGLLLLHAGLNRKPGLIRTVYLSTSGLAAFCVFLSFSRASWLGAAAAILGLFFLYPRFMVRLSVVAAPVVILLGGGPLANQFRFASERLYSAQSEQSALSRLPVFLAAVRMFEAKPLAGWGYGNLDRYDQQFQGRVGNFASDNKDHASHNIFLTLIAEQGLIGATSFLLPFIGWLILTLKRLPQLPAEGFWSRKLLIILWLAILNEFIVNSFSNMRVVYGLGVWWVSLGLIANMVYARRTMTSAVVGSPRVAAIENSHAEGL